MSDVLKLRTFLVSVSLVVLGALWTKLVRDYMFVESYYGHMDLENQLLGNHVYFSQNLHNLFVANWHNLNFVFSAFIIFGHLALVANCFLNKGPGSLALLSFSALLLTNILVFGLVNETRMLFPILSMYVFALSAAIAKRESRSS